MKKNFLTSFFGASSQKHNNTNQILSTISSLSKRSNLFIYSAVDIYHHSQEYTIPLIIYDEYRGLYIFEIKDWSYDELRNATIKKASNTLHSQNTLSYHSMHKVIEKKLNEIIHSANVPIFNYLIMTHLSSYEYQSLNESLKENLPKKRIVFNNLNATEILTKLQTIEESKRSFGTSKEVFGTLFTQYTILDKENKLSLCNEAQKEFIDKELDTLTNITAKPKSGKSSILLLKAIFEILKNPSLKIIIIKPTRLAKDILHRQLLEIIEHGIIEFNFEHLEIMTPFEINKKIFNDSSIEIPPKLIHKNFDLADLIMCDDCNFIDENFIAYLKYMQKKKKLVLVNDMNSQSTCQLNESYLSQDKKIRFHKTNPYAKALNIIPNLLNHIDPSNIVVVSNSLNREKLNEDLKSFIKAKAILLDSSTSLASQELNTLRLVTYKDLNEISYSHAILLDLEATPFAEIEYAIDTAKENVSLLYEEESQMINDLKEKYESS
ncbi:hypothetical protein [Sulfurimonas sp.]